MLSFMKSDYISPLLGPPTPMEAKLYLPLYHSNSCQGIYFCISYAVGRITKYVNVMFLESPNFKFIFFNYCQYIYSPMLSPKLIF